MNSINIRDYAIESLNSSILDKFSNLKKLLLINSSLIEFDFGAFKYPEKMRSIVMSSNNGIQLKNINLLLEFEGLAGFSVAENQLANIPVLIDALPATIEALVLSGNNVGELNEFSFQMLTNLTTLANASLTFTDSNPFEKLPLSYPDISLNNLNKLDFNLLSKTLQQIVDFNATQIRNISEVFDYFGPNLRILVLSNNNVAESNGGTFNISLDAFKQHTELDGLFIAYNHLNELDARLLPKKLKLLDISGNDLKEIAHR